MHALTAVRLLSWSLLATTIAFASLADAKTAWAVRLVEFEVLLDGKVVLRAHQGDLNNAGPDQVWDYLKTLEFSKPERRNVRESERAPEQFRIVPDADNPLRATVSGEIRLFARYGGDIQLKELHLVRRTPTDNKWLISPEDVERTKKERTVDSSQRARQRTR